MKSRKHAELIKWWLDGMEIQFLNSDGKWKDLPFPLWDASDYRKKPKQLDWLAKVGDLALFSDDGDNWDMGIVHHHYPDRAYPWMDETRATYKYLKPHPKQVRLDLYRDAILKITEKVARAQAPYLTALELREITKIIDEATK